MKYFFLAEGWVVGRVWELGGLWDETAWRRAPVIKRLNICLWEENELLWLYRVEDAVTMVEVKPLQSIALTTSPLNIGQVVLKRLIHADQVMEILDRSGNCNVAIPHHQIEG
ncbi:hypothetical protein [Merismopedia glauca]|uniref:Uncharacterized protein n=1 Tax=Merismopedia glauca CCAP 1448/3 TaxID=1296344 RepID=A0A2T1C7I0_9CYAN|nr:hypothetical protein [Merismopedia glauca]PSB04211.1 hypothetical protein C7B64_05010 [Merismopedia glauca CCAP 1448/3]